MVYQALNPWKHGRVPTPPTIDRSLFGTFEADLRHPEISVLLGARQTGKTTLLLETARRALAGGRVVPEHLHYLDLDTMHCEDVLFCNRSLLDFLGLTPAGGDEPPRVVLIDEIQRLENPGLFLKSVYDLGLNIKIVVTGSSSLEIRSRVRESLAGRSIRFHLWPLDPAECRHAALDGLERYLRWGGFPAVQLERDEVRRQVILANLLSSYLDRDIVDFLRVENFQGFRSFLQLLAGQVGQLVNLNELANTLALSRDTLARYLSYLEGTFMVRVLRPFVTNRRSELTKMPKVYFSDCGLRNLLTGRLAAGLSPSDLGSLFENVIEIMLRLDPRTENLAFWRTRGGAEVDFVWQAHGYLYAVEVKATPLSRPAVPRSLRSFVTTYHPRRAAVVAPGAEGEVMVGDTPVLFLPPERVSALLD